MVFVWDPALETGHAEIDRQHREMLELVNALESAQAESADELFRTMDVVTVFAQTHFLMEEGLMADVGYPAELRDAMRAAHGEFITQARHHFLEFRRDALGSVGPMQTFLAGWLAHHEMGMDRPLAEFIRAKARGSSSLG